MKYNSNFLKEISFPLGGIGTGSVGLGGDGRFIDWEIFNKPAKGSTNGYSHFAIRAIQGDKITAAVLNGDVQKEYMGRYLKKEFSGYGYGPNNQMCGFPHFRNIEFNGEFPIAELTFTDENFPGKITMTAFNPFIPLDSKNSSIPAAFFRIKVENQSDEEIKYQIALSIQTPFAKSLNKGQKKNGCSFLTLYNSQAKPCDIEYGDLTIGTNNENSFVQNYWYRGEWRDSIVTFWNEFSSDIKLKERNYTEKSPHSDLPPEWISDVGTVVAEITVPPSKDKYADFVMSWNIPNNYNYWAEETPEIRKPWKNYYATVFENSVSSALYSLLGFEGLLNKTIQFKNALHNSSLPPEVIDAASSNLSVLKSPTVLRLEDGSFYGWEGVHEERGSCEGTCQHVWNYAYAMCFLFPDLERTIRDMEFKYSTDTNGRMGFRIMLPLGRKMTDFRACVDGQMGAVIKCYREWKLSGDNQWLKDNWENIKKVLEYAWSDKNPDGWDLDKDGILEGRQHHTLDMELFGPSSWLEGMYLAALKAASEMAEFLGDFDKAKEYSSLFENGYNWTKDSLFNGKYFIQQIDISDKGMTDKYNASDKYWNDEAKQIKYQIANGSAIDQMLAQWHADIIGLGEIYDRNQISSALSYMMQNNFKKTMREFVNPWRIFSLNDESGSVICVYDKETEKPNIPIPYCEETMTGFEYSFAGLLCSQGKYEDGFKVVKAIRDRFDGEKRNPWNEFECGSNYARSMASYALIPILSGFEFDMPNKYIGFNPYIKENFSAVWSLADGWGIFEIKNNSAKIQIIDGEITINSIGLKFCKEVKSVIIDGNTIDFKLENGIISFEETKISDKAEIII